MSIDPTISEELSRQYFERFAEEIGTTPGYDWNDISPDAMSAVKETYAAVSAPPGYKRVVSQIVGECPGAGTTQTELFLTANGKEGSSDLEVVRYVWIRLIGYNYFVCSFKTTL